MLCAAQSNDVHKMSPDRCPQRYGNICQQTLYLDITFSPLFGNKIEYLNCREKIFFKVY